MRIVRVFPLLLDQVVQYQYVHSATLLMHYWFQTVNQQLHAPRRQALLRLLRLRSTNLILYKTQRSAKTKQSKVVRPYI